MPSPQLRQRIRDRQERRVDSIWLARWRPSRSCRRGKSRYCSAYAMIYEAKFTGNILLSRPGQASVHGRKTW